MDSGAAGSALATAGSSGEDRAIGALLGLAAGDATGTTLEFTPREDVKPITDMVGGGPFGLKPGQWTDDTSMALCLAESLLDTGEMDLTDQMRRYVMWRDDGYLSSTGRCFDIGYTTSAALSRFRETGQAVDPHIDPDMQANGSLMRLAPVPVRWFADVGEAAARSGESSLPTHNASAPVDACRVMGAMIAALVEGQSWAAVTELEFWVWGELDPTIDEVVRGSYRTKTVAEIKGSGHCVRALEAALWAVDGADDFRNAVLRAANLGDDADTTAAIAGQLAGARWGASGIPADWVRKVVLSERITEMARQLYRAGGGDLPGSSWPYDEVIHAYWVEPGRVLAGEYPGHLSAAKAHAKLDLLLDSGVRAVVDLTTRMDPLRPYAALLAQAATARGLEVIRLGFPIRDMGVADASVYDAIIAAIRSAPPGVVYVHCWGGRGRTGTVVGCLLVDDGLSFDEVIDRLAELRSTSSKAHVRVPESRAQDEVIRQRATRRG